MMQSSRLISPSSSRKTNSNEVSKRFLKPRDSSWRSTHSTALQYLSLLGNKFRLYLSALGNISVYVFVIFITLSVFNVFQEFNLSIYKVVRTPASPPNAARPRKQVPKIIRYHQRFEWEDTEKNLKRFICSK